MLKNYLKAAWRNLFKNKVFSFINVSGLAAGMAVAILIGLWIWDELSFNKYHQHYDRIAQVMKAFPNQQFILLGDSSQQDPYIYSSLVKDFPGKIYAVYIRDVYEKNRKKVTDALALLTARGVACCFFKHSTEAIKHSEQIGLIK